MPEELVEVAMFHVLKHHDERVTLHAHPVESNNVFMLKVGQQLSFALEILPGILTGLLQRLPTHRHTHIITSSLADNNLPLIKEM